MAAPTDAQQLEYHKRQQETAKNYSVVSALLVGSAFGAVLVFYKDGRQRNSLTALRLLSGTTSFASLAATVGYMLQTLLFATAIDYLSSSTVQRNAADLVLGSTSAVWLRWLTCLFFLVNLAGLSGIFITSCWVAMPHGAARTAGLVMYSVLAALLGLIIVLYQCASGNKVGHGHVNEISNAG